MEPPYGVKKALVAPAALDWDLRIQHKYMTKSTNKK